MSFRVYVRLHKLEVNMTEWFFPINLYVHVFQLNYLSYGLYIYIYKPVSILKNIDSFSSQNCFLKCLQTSKQLNVNFTVIGLVHWNVTSMQAGAFQPWDQLEVLFLETPRCQEAVSGSNFSRRINEGNSRWYWAGVFGKTSEFKRNRSANQMGNMF